MAIVSRCMQAMVTASTSKPSCPRLMARRNSGPAVVTSACPAEPVLPSSLIKSNWRKHRD